MTKVDAKHRKIIQELYVDGRIPVNELSKKVGLSRSRVAERLQYLEKTGVILGHTIRLNYEKIGYMLVETWFTFRTFGGEKKKEIIEYFVNHKYTRWVGEALSQFNMRVVFVVKDRLHLERIISEIYTHFGSEIMESETNILGESGLHVETRSQLDEKVQLRPTDVKLIRELKKNGRATLTELSKKLGIGIETARKHIQNLVQANVIMHFRCNLDPKKIGDQWLIYVLRFNTLNEDLRKKMSTYIKEKPFAGTAYTIIGNWHYHLTINAVSNADLALHTQDVQNTFGEYLEAAFPAIIVNSYKYPPVAEGVFEDLLEHGI